MLIGRTVRGQSWSIIGQRPQELLAALLTLQHPGCGPTAPSGDPGRGWHSEMWEWLALLPLAQQRHLTLAGEDRGILFLFSNLLCTWNKLTVLRPCLMKQINLENGSPVSLVTRASADGPLVPPLASPLSLLGGQLWRLLTVWVGAHQEPGVFLLFSSVGGSSCCELCPSGSASRELCGGDFWGSGNPWPPHLSH